MRFCRKFNGIVDLDEIIAAVGDDAPGGSNDRTRASGRPYCDGVDDEIYLDPASPPPPPARRPFTGAQRLALAAALVLVVGMVVLVQRTRGDGAGRGTVAAPTASPVQRAWPLQPGTCGQQIQAPIVTSDPLTESTGGQLTQTGTRPGLVSVDDHAVLPVPNLTLAGDQYVSDLVISPTRFYALVRSCQRREVGVVMSTADDGRPQQVLAGGDAFYGLLSDGGPGVWGEMYTGNVRPEAAIGTTLWRLDRTAPAVTLPSWLNPVGLYGHTLVGTTNPDPVRSTLYLFDLGTHRLRSLGPTYGTSVTRGTVVWNSAPCSPVDGACPLHTYDLATGGATARTFHLPLESTFDHAVLNPARTRLAFVLERETSDPRYLSRVRSNPADLVELDLRTGVVNPVPNLELAPGSPPDRLSFSASGDWLLVGFDTAGGSDVYAWRPGLNRPVSPGRS